jgi:hypothetical protein
MGTSIFIFNVCPAVINLTHSPIYYTTHTLTTELRWL